MARIELFIPSSTSLKDKRRVIRSAMDSVRRHNHAAITEIENQDLWQRASLGVACVGSSSVGCEKVLQQVEKTVARAIIGSAEMIDVERFVVAMKDLV